MRPETGVSDAERGRSGPLLWQEDERDEGPEASTPSGSDMHIRSGLSDGGEGYFPVPVWLHESSKSFHWKWVPLRARKVARAVAAWSKGPDPPQIQRITPFFPFIQEAPAYMIERYLPKILHKAGLLAIFYFCWLLTFTLVLDHSAKAGNISGYGKPQSIWCGASFWYVSCMAR